MTKPFLILQLRPEDEAADGEYRAMLEKGGLPEAQSHRIRVERDPLPDGLDLSDYAGVVVGGGPGCVSDDPVTKPADEARAEAAILSLMGEICARDIPFMGCCYGISILAHHLGAPVDKSRFGEPVGSVEVTLTGDGADDPLLRGLPRVFTALVGHKEATQALPEGAVHLVSSAPCPYQMIRYGRNVYATQFHPEADGQVFADRIRIYRDRGYFPPEDARRLTDQAMAADAGTPPEILRRFFARYG
ncbi:glutamine amidotransferase [Ovoidimarina sediminis]|uniref:glutamine amidotransferase n=1 Tax=Ovoidimarina sediminis TaxID=3079856 RepID=UPI00290C4D40|nr:glutamine amidotransferase [Rhodophyticola sp. MJ-SS7]MDU8942904.1 glutamine amidotransferase [Rhodophyticola sp. MJ-SS7]